MASPADKNLSKQAQDKINNITKQAESGKISWSEANKQANAVRASEGADYSVSAKGTTTYNDGSTISSNKTGNKTSGGKASATMGGGSGSNSQYTNVQTTPQYTGVISTNPADYNVSDGANMKRNPALAGQSVKQGHYTITYNEDGYAVKAVKDNGASATSTVKTTHAHDSELHQLAYQEAAKGNWDRAYQYLNKIGETYGERDENGMWDMTAAKLYAQELQNEFLYDANRYYGDMYDSIYGAGAWDGGTGTGTPTYNDYSEALVNQYRINEAAQQMTGGAGSDSALLDALGGMIGIYGEKAEPTLPDIDLGALGGSFDYGDFGGASGAPEWNGSEWDSVLESLAQQLLGMSYDQWTQGDQYASLANRYGQQGRLSMQDVLGQVSSRTGGLASSWAQTAANQQYNSFMSDLERAAMEMYGVEQGDLLDKANLARQYAMDDYNEYVDRWNQWADNRDFAYDAYRDSVADQQYADALALEQAKDQAELLAAAGDFSGYGALGYSDDQIGLLQAAYAAQNAQTGKDASKKTGGGGGFDNGSLSTAQVKQLQQALGVTADGLWGKNSKAAAGGLSAGEAWAALGGGSLGGGGNDYWTGNGSTSGGKTSLNWDQDEGIFTWNGRNYYSVAELADAIDAANLTDAEKQALTRKFGTFGFDIEIT